ncbi:MAG: hypothetical protein NW237_15645 [Cyanobacteriota bacterium]|nr:hypothetical protein [Cyanobacteriota bacterium]
MLALEGLPILAALLIAILLIGLLIRVVKETIWTGLGILVILAILFFLFGITPLSIFREMMALPSHWQELWQRFFGG